MQGRALDWNGYAQGRRKLVEWTMDWMDGMDFMDKGQGTKDKGKGRGQRTRDKGQGQKAKDKGLWTRDTLRGAENKGLPKMEPGLDGHMDRAEIMVYDHLDF